MSDFNNILSVLDTISKENTVSFYVPSLKREVLFKGINTGQQKALLKAAIDNPVFQTRFILAAYAIINENCTEKDILAQLTAIDSMSILLQYRVNIYGSEYKTEQEGKTYTLNLSDSISRIREIEIPGPQTFVDGPVTITVGVPTFTEQFLLEKQVREKTLNEQDNTTLNETIGEAFIGEISKFIKQIQVIVNDQQQDLNYKDLTFPKKYAVLEKLPTKAVKQIISYLESVANIQRKFTRVNGIDEANNVKEIEFTIDSSLFALN